MVEAQIVGDHNRMEAVAQIRMNTIRNPKGAEAAAFGLGFITTQTEGTSPREMMT